MIDSMVSGIFAGDARSLSLRACFPKMWQLETDHGGLFRALLATRKRRRKGDAVGAPAGRLMSFDAGMETLIRGAAEALGGSLRTSSGVESVRRGRATRGVVDLSPAAGFTLATAGGTVEVDAVVLAGPATESAALIRPFDADTAALLAGIPTASLAVVCLGYDEQAIAAERGPLAGFGFLVPRSENVRILGALWETSIYPGHRAPEGKALVRVMIGGALDPEAVVLDDEQLIAIVRADLARTMGLKNPPEFVRIIRHARGIPQYAVSIAASRGEEVVAGVVVNVASGEVFAATRGGGSTLDGRPLRVRDVVPLEQCLIATGFNYVAEVRALQAAAVGRMLNTVRDIRRLGSAALDLCALAAGRIDGFVEEGLNPWDRAAGGLIATEAGARVETWPGAGGTDCVVAGPAAGFDNFSALVEKCGFLAGERE